MREPATKPDNSPNGMAWALAIVGLVLPWIAIPVGLLGLLAGLRGDRLGWLLLAFAFALLVLDIAIDVIWARIAAARSDEPGLNLRGNALVGRTAIVTEAIVAGRGKVRIGDTVWLAEGPDMAAGASVEVVASTSVVLRVTPVDRA